MALAMTQSADFQQLLCQREKRILIDSGVQPDMFSSLLSLLEEQGIPLHEKASS